ncbi:MAG: GTPase Era [Gammaproteobacteria bacterium]|nr:MAG: GTPase Era [Gammaproteobacteria bacterium]
MNSGSESIHTRCGYVAILGCPNVGKSTLLNHLLGQKISITSRKPQTTRHRVLGIKTDEQVQIIFVDTPGIHKSEPKAINRYMNRAAVSAVNDVDAILLVVEAGRWTEEDEHVLAQLNTSKAPVILVINKIDKLEDKAALLPFIESLSGKYDFKTIVPVSALRNKQLDALEQEIQQCLPQSIHFFPEDQITDRSQRFMAAEIIREKIMRQLGQEVPYSMTVEIEQMKQKGKTWHLHALILVERPGQKNIVIGKQGQRLKSIGSEARKDIEQMLDSKVMLNLWVKVKGGWSDDERALRSLGFDDQDGF